MAIDYLKTGNKRQQECYEILKRIKIMDILQDFDPILVGTIPLSIDIPESDLDIICNTSDTKIAQNIVRANFEDYLQFSDKIKQETYIASFMYNNTEIEIYAKNEPTKLQYGYRHMAIESRILNLTDDYFKNKVVELKMNGYKTEPAFGKLLNLKNPFSYLLELEKLTEEELADFIISHYDSL